MRLFVMPVVAVTLLAVAAPAARAQSLAAPATPAAAAASVVAPASPSSVTVAGRLALDEARLVRVPAAQRPQRTSFGQAEALMIVGGAALIGGLVIGGDAGTLISIVGLGVGLYGLYQFLQ
jgi:hypothetical protein